MAKQDVSSSGMLSNIWLAFVDMLKEMLGILQETWPLFKDNLTVTLGIPAVLVIVPMALVGIPAGGIAFLVAITSPITKLPTIPALVVVGVVAGAFFAVVYNSIRVGWTKVLLELESGGEATFSDIKAGMPWFVNFVIVNLIIGTAIAAGSYCFIVPGIFVAVRAAYAPFLVVDENLGPIEAIMRSNELVTGYSWQILIYHCLYFLAGTVGGFIPVVGSIAVMGYFDMTLAKIYVLRKSGDLEDDDDLT